MLIKFLIPVFFSLSIQLYSQSPFPMSEAERDQNDPNKSILTPETLLTMKRVGEPALSPDGNWIAYSVGIPDIKENLVNKDIYLISTDGRSVKPIARDRVNEYSPVWSPEGKRIAFISNRGGSPQAYIYYTDSNKAVQITKMKEGIANLSWSPDGKFLSFTSEVQVIKPIQNANYPGLPKTNVRIYESLPVRHWDEWLNGSYSHLFIMPVQGGEPADLMENEPFDCPVKPFGGREQICWSPNGMQIAYTSKKIKNYVQSTNTDIFLVNIVNRKTENLSSNLPGMDLDPSFSPDGKYLAFHSLEREGYESDRVRLMLINLSTGDNTAREIPVNLDQWVGEFAWAWDSKSIFFCAENGPTVQVYNTDIQKGKWEILTKGDYNYEGGLQVSRKEPVIYVCRQSMLRPPEIYAFNYKTGDIRQLTTENDELYGKISTVRIERQVIKSQDKKDIVTWVLYPPHFSLKHKYPMITYCQGGPQSTVSQNFSYRWNLFLYASQGYLVVAPNRRGLPGFGQSWNDAINKDWGGMPMNDILTVTDKISSESYIDKDRLAAIGASAGGYAVFWLEGNHKKRFSAFVAHSGVYNMESKYGSTEELWFPNWEFGGPYWEIQNKPFYEKNSPHNYAQNWDTPILISAGENDFRVPYTQSLEAFTVAQVKNIPSKLIIFPEQNHWILKPQEQILWYKEVLDFLEKYCKKR